MRSACSINLFNSFQVELGNAYENHNLNYYNITLLGSPLETFTYHFSQTIKIGAKVSFNFRNRVVDGVVLSSCEKPSFETNEVLEVSDFFLLLRAD